MRTSHPQFISELHTTDGSSVRSSDDGSSPGGEDRERAKLVAKVEATKEKLKFINLQREGDVEEFLSMSKEAEQQRGADNPQMARIRQTFEKKNKRHSHDTEQLQKKLKGYEQKLAELDNGTLLDTSQRTNYISSMGQGIKRTGANIKGMTETVIAAPMELAHRIKNTFGSADNVNDSHGPSDDSRVGHSVFYASSEHGSSSAVPASAAAKASTLPAGLKMDMDMPLMTSTPARGNPDKRYSVPMNDSFLSLDAVGIVPTASEELLDEIKKLRGQMSRVEDKCDKMTTSFQNEIADLNRTLDEERFKYKKLEEMLNETIELHQAEFLSLKQEQKNIANRLDYQYNDRFRSVEENVEAVQNQMCRMENSIQHTLDMRLGGNAWGNTALLSGANILVELLKIFLYIVATVLDFFRPFTGSRTKAGIFIFVFLTLFFILQYVDFSALFRRSKSSPEL